MLAVKSQEITQQNYTCAWKGNWGYLPITWVLLMHAASHPTSEFCNRNQYWGVESFLTVCIQQVNFSFSTSMLFFICLLKCSACRNFHSTLTSRRLVCHVNYFMKQFLLQKCITTFSLQSFVLEIMLCCILMMLEDFCIQSISLSIALVFMPL